MKTKNIVQKWTCLALSLILVLSAAAALATDAVQTSFSLRNGITWDTTPGEMIAFEGLGEDDYAENVLGDAYSLQYTAADGQSVSCMFYLDKPVLLMAMYKSDDADNFDVQRAALVAQYGEPNEMDKDLLYEHMNVFGMGSLSDDNLAAFAGWSLEDGSLIYLIDADGEVGALFFQLEPFKAALDYIASQSN